MKMTAWTPRVAIILSIVAFNLHGASAQRAIEGKTPKLTVVPAAPVEGDKVTLTCAFDANEQEADAVFTWKLDPIPAGWGGSTVEMDTGVYVIENIQSYIYSNIKFTCKANKQFGSTTAFSYVSDPLTLVISPAPAPTTPAPTTPAPTTPAPTTPAPTTPAPTTPAVVTKEIKLESWNWNYFARSWAHLGSVQSMVLVKEHDYSQEHASPLCHEEGDNATFGFHGATTWVKDGCRGDFTVTLDTADTTSAEFDRLAGRLDDLDEETELLESTLESQNAKIAELRCTVASLNEDDPVHGCCCPVGWTKHHPDGKLICYRQATTNDDALYHTEAKSLCKDLHPRSVLVMPKTPAQLDVLRSFMTTDEEGDEDYEYDHIGMDVDASGNHTWKDGSAVDPNIVWDTYNSRGEGPCGENYEFSFSHDEDMIFCSDSGRPHDDGKQLCQLMLNDCDEAEE